MTKVEGVRRRRRRTQLLDDLRARRYWEVKEEAEDRKIWKLKFVTRTEKFAISLLDRCQPGT